MHNFQDIPSKDRKRKRTNEMSSNKQVKKIVVKGFSPKPKAPENYEAEAIKQLKLAVQAIHAEKPTSFTYEELYQHVVNLVSCKVSANLYSHLKRLLELRSKEVYTSLRSHLQSDYPIFLSQINAFWTAYCRQTMLIRSIFLYLDRTYILQSPTIPSLWDLALSMFRLHVVAKDDVRKKTVDGVITLVTSERNGEGVDRTLLKSLSRMLVDLGLYSPYFDERFIEVSQHYYRSEGQRCIEELDPAGYLRHVEARLGQENERVQSYLDPGTAHGLLTTVEVQLLTEHCPTLVAKGFETLMKENRIEDLSRMFDLFRRVQKLELLQTAFCSYIKTHGSVLVKEPERDKQLIVDVLAFKDRIDTVLESAFKSNTLFSEALRTSFEGFLNLRENRPAELLAKFVDSKLRSSNKDMTEADLDHLLDRVMVLFRFLHSKDVFEAFYKDLLAKRLLMFKSASVDAEKNMLSKLKAECGAGFTSKLEGMFKDMEISRELTASFLQSEERQLKLHGLGLEVAVLTTGYWPISSALTLKLPVEMLRCQEVFREFYLNQHNGRKLTWQNNMGQCVVKAVFDKAAKELVLVPVQAVVLLCFNHSTSLSTTEIIELTGADKNEIVRTLQSLACAKFRILNKSTKGKTVADTDIFTVNTDFQHKLFRVKISTVMVKETAEENAETNEKIFQDRAYQVDAAIVRIMKTRNCLSHKELKTEVMLQVRFPLSTQNLKQRIESLMDRDYLERNDKIDGYNYLA